MHFDNDRYSRSVYPTASMPLQENIILENIYIENKIEQLLDSVTPCDCLKIINSVIDNSIIHLRPLPYKTKEYPEMKVFLSGNTFKGDGGCILDCEEDRAATLEITGSIIEKENSEFFVQGNVKVLSSDIKISTHCPQSFKRYCPLELGCILKEGIF